MTFIDLVRETSESFSVARTTFADSGDTWWLSGFCHISPLVRGSFMIGGRCRHSQLQ